MSAALEEMRSLESPRGCDDSGEEDEEGGGEE
jgi:hypothetical protein